MTPAQRAFQIHAATWFAVTAFFVMIWLLGGAGHPWFLYPAGAWGIGLAAHATATFTRPIRHDDDLELEPGPGSRSLGR